MNRKSPAIVVVLLIAAILILSVTQQQRPLMQGITLPALQIDGPNITDGLGNVVVLRGPHKHGYEDQSGGRWDGSWGTYNEGVIRTNFQAMRSWGFNHVRIFIRCQFWTDNTPDAAGTPFQTQMSNLLTLAEEEGLYVVFCAFSLRGGTGYHQPPWNGGEPFPGGLEDFKAFWVDIATKLGTHRNVLFELWNEVASGKETWFNGVQETITAIRAVSSRIIIVQWDWECWYREGLHQGVGTIDSWALDARIQGTNILFSTHQYNEGRGYYRNGGDTYFHTEADVRKALTAERLNWFVSPSGGNRPLYQGETGYMNTPPDAETLESLQHSFQFFQDYNISWNVVRWTPSVDMYALYVGSSGWDNPSPWGALVKSFALGTPIPPPPPPNGNGEQLYQNPGFVNEANISNNLLFETGYPFIKYTWETTQAPITIQSIVLYSENSTLEIVVDGSGIHSIIIDCVNQGQPTNVTGASSFTYSIDASTLEMMITFDSEALITISWEALLPSEPPGEGEEPLIDSGDSEVLGVVEDYAYIFMPMLIASVAIVIVLYRRKRPNAS